MVTDQVVRVAFDDLLALRRLITREIPLDTLVAERLATSVGDLVRAYVDSYGWQATVPLLVFDVEERADRNRAARGGRCAR